MARPVASLAVLALLVAALAPGEAAAHGAGGAGQLPKDAPTVTPEGAKAKGEIEAMEKDPRARTVVARALKSARQALGRAHGAHLVGDGDAARILSRVALAWTRASRAVLRAADAEGRADVAETKAKELKEKLERARALLAETDARRGQLSVEVARAEAGAKLVTAGALESEKKRVEKSQPKKTTTDKGPAPKGKKP